MKKNTIHIARKSITVFLCATIMIICVLPTTPMVKSATTVVIDFEEFRATSLGGLGGRNEINDYYSSYGVRFTGARSLSKADGSLNYMRFPPRSGDAVVYDWPSGYSGTTTITFDTPQSSVGGYFTTNTALTFTAYDASGNIVGTDNSLNQANYIGSGSDISPNYYLHVDYTGGITKVVIMDGGNTYTLDDLTFTALSDTIPPGKVSDLNAHAISLTPTGFVYPTGKKEDGRISYNYATAPDAASYYRFAGENENKWGWLARDADYGWTDFYHVAQDIPAEVNDPVYAIADGEIVHISTRGWGDGNVGIFVKHTLNTEDVFLAVYGHVRDYKLLEFDDTLGWPNVENPVQVKAGEAFAIVGPWCMDGSCDDTHLHFGIHLGESTPPYIGEEQEPKPRRRIG